MKIIDKDTSSRKDLSLLEEGDLFRIAGDNDIYMKINDMLSQRNAVRLVDGKLMNISYYNIVYKVNAYLVEQ
jgi:hypothetical protein